MFPVTIQPEFRGEDSASPGVCYLCKAARRPGEVVIDWGFEVDRVVEDGVGGEFIGAGWFQTCSGCLAEYARLIGMVDTDRAETLAAELALECSRRQEAEAALDRAETALDAMKVYRSQKRKPLVDAEA